jgi:hypothetical protein
VLKHAVISAMADGPIDAERLACFIIEEINLYQRRQHRLALLISYLIFMPEPTTCSREIP